MGVYFQSPEGQKGNSGKQHLADPRGKNTRLPFADLLRQSVYSRLAGYEEMTRNGSLKIRRSG